MLSVIFVMIAEILIFVPSIARFRQDYLNVRLEKAQIASLSVLASTDQMVSPELAQELLDNAEVYNVVLRRDAVRQLVLTKPLPGPVTTSVDLRDPSAWYLIKGAVRQLLDPSPGVIRAFGFPTKDSGVMIDVAMPQKPLRDAMIDYGLRILWLSLVISAVSALLLFVAVRRVMVRPVMRVVRHMEAYAQAPEDARRIITPEATITELRSAEDALAAMQQQLTGSLKQKERLAQLGGAVAKISHDLRNILTTATLIADRMEASEDPRVKRSAPKLVNSLSRAVNLCEGTLAFGRVDEPQPSLSMIDITNVVEDVLEGERLATDGSVEFTAEIGPGLLIRADEEQLLRVLGNLVRNARQAIEATGNPGQVVVTAAETDMNWTLTVRDTGPGLPPKAQEHLFQAFEGGVRKGGTGLGLAIAAELIRGHGGALHLRRTGPEGTEFELTLPKGSAIFQDAAQ